ncbi:hypothetical protein V7O62_12315 [Methanolobus sp. ZRKC2]|uniref:hypothetical protein n=1 Tax=Methanolobus sp. ZRKC2 TaxID=3125783 RepID=UPI00324DD932
MIEKILRYFLVINAPFAMLDLLFLNRLKDVGFLTDIERQIIVYSGLYLGILLSIFIAWAILNENAENNAK